MNIVGHEENRERLRNLITSNKIGHAYLFAGRAGIGKRLVAIEFARNMMCLNNTDGVACNTCEVCNTFENNSDFYIVEQEKNIIKVDEIRKLESEIYLKPTKANRKCFIINDADLMNESAQNALLKVLEEPPRYATIILVATNKEKLLGTIKSRVISINFNALTNRELQKVLGEDFNPEIIDYAKGSVQSALSLADENYICVANSLLESFLSKDFLKINKKIDEIKNDKNLKYNISNILEAIMLICYKQMKKDIDLFVKIIDIVNETNKNIERNANVDLALDSMIIRICSI